MQWFGHVCRLTSSNYTKKTSNWWCDQLKADTGLLYKEDFKFIVWPTKSWYWFATSHCWKTMSEQRQAEESRHEECCKALWSMQRSQVSQVKNFCDLNFFVIKNWFILEIFLFKYIQLQKKKKNRTQRKCVMVLQLYWNYTSAWVFSCKFATYFQNTFY